MPDFSVRSRLPERMDDPLANPDQLVINLRELEIINRYLGGYTPVLEALAPFVRKQQRISILDVGSGAGDTLRVIHQHFAKHLPELILHGADINPVMIEYSRKNSPAEIQFYQLNVLEDDFPLEKYDLVICNLFLHHLQDEHAQLLRKMISYAAKAVLVTDLHRHPAAYYSIHLLSQLFSRSAYLKYDAPLSVLRGFSRQDLEVLLAEAGISTYELGWKWAFRWQLLIKTGAEEEI